MESKQQLQAQNSNLTQMRVTFQSFGYSVVTFESNVRLCRSIPTTRISNNGSTGERFRLQVFSRDYAGVDACAASRSETGQSTLSRCLSRSNMRISSGPAIRKKTKLASAWAMSKGSERTL